MKPILFIVLVALSWNLYGQTELQGGIYNDQVLSKDLSPYLITGDVVLFPDKTLIIEPGVEIIFQDDFYFEIRGHLIAVGSVADTIKFKTLNDPFPLDSMPWNQFDWEAEKKGLVIDYPTSTLKLEYCSFSNFQKALHIYNISDVYLKLKNCVFTSNLYGFVKFSNNRRTLLDSCQFNDNSVGLYTGDTYISMGSFTKNYYGITGWYKDTISKSSFLNNAIGIADGGNGMIQDCLFEENEIGVINSWSGIKMERNTLINNRIGIRLNLFGTTSANMLTNNWICNNSLYNVENTSSTNIALNSNCWCTSDSSEIEAKIYDGYDNITSGLINYDIFNESCSSVLKSVSKVYIYTGIVPAEDLKFSVYPVPFDDFINVSLPMGSRQYSLRLVDINGRVVYDGSIKSTDSWSITTDEFQAGTYILELSDGKSQKQKLLIKL